MYLAKNPSSQEGIYRCITDEAGWVKIGVPGLNSLTDLMATFEFSSATPITGRTSIPSSSFSGLSTIF